MNYTKSLSDNNIRGIRYYLLNWVVLNITKKPSRLEEEYSTNDGSGSAKISIKY